MVFGSVGVNFDMMLRSKDASFIQLQQDAMKGVSIDPYDMAVYLCLGVVPVLIATMAYGVMRALSQNTEGHSVRLYQTFVRQQKQIVLTNNFVSF